MNSNKTAYFLASGSLVALIVLCVLWELYIAPLRAGGSLMALKALPLLLPLAGILRGKVYSYQWAVLLILFYFAEGVMRLFDSNLASQICAALQVIFSLVFFIFSIVFIRYSPKNVSK